MANISKLSPRKQRLLACACVRRVWAMLSSPALREAIVTAEAFADGECTIESLRDAYNAAAIESRLLAEHSESSLAAWAATRTAMHERYCNRPFGPQETIHLSQIVTEALIPGDGPTDEQVREPRQAEADIHQQYLEDVELSASISFSPSWRTDTAIALARQMYESRDFGAMPVLADALQDAGCEEPAILSHCRDPKQLHVRGCWVTDLVLGKQ